MTGQNVKQSSQKLGVYETLTSLNQGFAHVLADLQRLQEFGWFRPASLQHFRLIVEETRAGANFELVETMHEREQNDWARFGRLRNRWEQRYKDPNDVLLEAESLKQKTAQVHWQARHQRRQGSKP